MVGPMSFLWMDTVSFVMRSPNHSCGTLINVRKQSCLMICPCKLASVWNGLSRKIDYVVLLSVIIKIINSGMCMLLSKLLTAWLILANFVIYIVAGWPSSCVVISSFTKIIWDMKWTMLAFWIYRGERATTLWQLVSVLVGRLRRWGHLC